MNKQYKAGFLAGLQAAKSGKVSISLFLETLATPGEGGGTAESPQA